MSLTREDMLRELELLPVWRLRAPVPAAIPAAEVAPEVAAPVAETPATQAPPLRMLLSEDASFLFLLAPTTSADEETLLQNMLKAMVNNGMAKIKVDAQALDIRALQAKLIVAMGEAAAELIGLSARGQVQQTSYGAVLQTFSPAHLLANPVDKALAWQDLCLALKTLQDLQSR